MSVKTENEKRVAVNGKLESLPKWAQDRITLLERDVAYWKDQAYAVSVDGETDTSVRDLMSSRGLPPGASVRFGPPGDIHNFIEVRIVSQPGENVAVDIHSARGLAIRPRASNTVVAECREW